MNPTEVAGLQGLAMSQGGSLTINPHTGLPEAFSLGGFFKSLLPMFVGAATGGASMPLWAGIAAGAATGAVLNKKDPLMGAAMGGLGGYGGFGIGKSLFNAGAPTLGAGVAGGGSSGLATGGGYIPGATSAADIAYNSAMMAPTAGTVNTGLSSVGTSMMTDPSILNARNAAQSITSAGGGAGSPIANSAASAAEKALSQYGSNLSQAKTGLGNIFSGDQAAIDAYTKGIGAESAMGALGKTAMPLGGALLGGLEPSDIYGEPINMDAAKKKQAYDPYATLNLSGDTGLRLYAVGGTVTTGGLRDLYGTADNNTNPQLSRDGYGVGRLDSLAREQSMTQAQTTGYAMGGDVGISDIAKKYLTVSLDEPISKMLGRSVSNLPTIGQGLSKLYPTFAPTYERIAAGEKGMNLDNLPTLNVNTGTSMARGGYLNGYAMGGPVSFADGGDSNKEDAMGLPSLSPDMPMNPNVGADNSAMVQSAMQPMQGMQGNAPMTQGQMPDQSNDSLIAKVTANLKADPNYQPENPIEAAIVKQIRGTDPMQQGQPSLQGLGSLGPSQPMAPSYNPSQSMAPSFNPSVAMGPTYFAGINAPQGYADGGDVVAGEKGMNLDELPSLNLNFVTNPITGEQLQNKDIMMAARHGIVTPWAAYGVNPDNYDGYLNKMAALAGGIKNRIPFTKGFKEINAAQPKSYALNVNSGQQEAQYAQGGYLDGAGDGMSDSIPATIEGKQPARLADGEFVIPADVVSHIGNGSSKAGSKRLYTMLDKVRHARTGNKKQGKEIKAEKYLPA
jgi:hypothetical protein